MILLGPATLAELQQHERACKASVVLGSHGLAPPETFSLRKALIEPDDADKLHLLNCGFAACTQGQSGRLADLDAELLPPETRQRADSFLRPAPDSGRRPLDLRAAPQLALLLACADADNGPWVIIDGNHRAIAQQLRHGSLAWVPVFLCIHPAIATWSYVPASFTQTAALVAEQGGRPSARQILRLCARIEPHPQPQRDLTAACSGFAAWDELIRAAEAEGMAPLLLRHLTAATISLPDAARRTLRLLSAHHRQTNLILIKMLGRVLTLLETQGIPALAHGGAALCQTLYPEPGLRPLSGLDLLLADKDIAPACALLRQHCFSVLAETETSAVLCQTADGVDVSLRLSSSSQDFSKLLRNAVSCTADGVRMRALAADEMLLHLCSLACASCKLITSADIVGLLESRSDLFSAQ